MVEFEGSRFKKPERSRFQPFPGYKDHERVPQRVVTQTDAILGMYDKGIIQKPELVRNYLQEYTFTYLNATARGVEQLYSASDGGIDAQELEVNEAVGFSGIIFAWMHVFTESRFLPQGFSRRGMLQAPATRDEFLGRITELKRELSFVVTRNIESTILPEARPSLLRTRAFFHVGALIPMKFPETQRDKDENEKARFSTLLDGIDINLP